MSLTTFGEKLELRSEIEVLAPPTELWRHLTDFVRYSEWNPFIVRASGKLECGERIDLIVSPPECREIRVRRRISQLREPFEIRWDGPYGFGLLLRSDQYVLLTAKNDSSSTRLVIGENLYGPGVTRSNSMVMNIARGTALMNQALKRRVESARNTLSNR